MSFHSHDEVVTRLTQNPAPLSDEEMIDLYPWMQGLTTGAAHRLNTELALRTGQAIARFDKNSNKAARWSLLLNGAMLFLSGLAIFIAVGSYHQAERSATEQQSTLNASRTALEQVLATTTEQQKLLQQSVEAARQQLFIIRGQRVRKK
jgi:hypothetical protein